MHADNKILHFIHIETYIEKYIIISYTHDSHV